MQGRKTGGRVAGTPNKFTQICREKLAAVAETIPDSCDAHAVLVAVYKDKAIELHFRLKAAANAIPYEKPRLAAITHSGPDGGPIEVTTTKAQRDACVAAALRSNS